MMHGQTKIKFPWAL